MQTLINRTNKIYWSPTLKNRFNQDNNPFIHSNNNLVMEQGRRSGENIWNKKLEGWSPTLKNRFNQDNKTFIHAENNPVMQQGRSSEENIWNKKLEG